MPMISDLHIHSKYSVDGELDIQQLIDKCLSNNISTFSITDHNSVAAAQEAINRSSALGLHFIPGIEIDCTYKDTDLHLLGYNINWQSNDFAELEKSMHRKVMDIFPEMTDNLSKLGIEVDENEVLEKAKGTLPCAELIAEVLLTNPVYHTNKKLLPYMPGGQRSDMPYLNFYHDFFAQAKPAYVKIHYISFQEAIDLVKSNGGTAVIAHPGLNFKGKEELIIELIDAGADGLEVFNNYHDVTQIGYLANLSVQKSVLMTCGSDFHGKNKPLIDIGKFKTLGRYCDYLDKSIRHLTDEGGKKK
jgi:3',5'-nucleoside bisphosphate phosphatase